MASNPPPSTTSSESAPLLLSHSHNDKKHHLLLSASGSVATIKLPSIISALSLHPALSIRLILTPSASHFLRGQSAEQPCLTSLARLPNVDGVYLDEDEWAEPWVRGGKILHIELRRWAHLLVVAPLSANSLAKVVGGFADGLLLSVIRAWDASGVLDLPYYFDPNTSEEEDGKDLVGKGADEVTPRVKRILVAPSMNTAMWKHPVTKKQIAVLEGEWGVAEVYIGYIILMVFEDYLRRTDMVYLIHHPISPS
ncbi:flavo protein [Aulographum hederae CBS 113979]|uniref:Flavo protein n=1 Tax=Aulographum hederae CBS 113979 TaxID=1176131 RepID=A0A6G1H4I9_9PEZI|nr:flavo protein [Aulographum hederae CBS 113979]